VFAVDCSWSWLKRRKWVACREFLQRRRQRQQNSGSRTLELRVFYTQKMCGELDSVRSVALDLTNQDYGCIQLLPQPAHHGRGPLNICRHPLCPQYTEVHSKKLPICHRNCASLTRQFHRQFICQMDTISRLVTFGRDEISHKNRAVLSIVTLYGTQGFGQPSSKDLN
jgi:hypothetical protein